MAHKTESIIVTDLKHTTKEAVKYDDKVIKRVIADALMSVDGFLGTTGGFLGARHKSATEEAELMKGISFSMKNGRETEVHVKAIVELGKSVPEMVDMATNNVIAALRDTLGLQTKAVKIDISKAMSAEEYRETYIKGPKE